MLILNDLRNVNDWEFGVVTDIETKNRNLEDEIIFKYS
jgi:hypothetical protein